jgi:hypothetical protein
VTFPILPSRTAMLATITSPTDTVGLLIASCVYVTCAETFVVEAPETIAANAAVPKSKTALPITNEPLVKKETARFFIKAKN